MSFAIAAGSDNTRTLNEMEISRLLKTLAAAEADFRGNDRDGNRIQDFWTGDVAGLYYLAGFEGHPLGLIRKAIADADAKPLRPGAPPPKAFRGYYLVAMEAEAGGLGGAATRYDPVDSGRHTSKFGFCAYPVNYPGSGRFTYAINEGNTAFKLDTGGKPLLRWPADEQPCDRCGFPERKAWCSCLQ